jgi:hypothetical protein
LAEAVVFIVYLAGSVEIAMPDRLIRKVPAAPDADYSLNRALLVLAAIVSFFLVSSFIVGLEPLLDVKPPTAQHSAAE